MIDKLFSVSRFLLVGVFFALYINEGKGQGAHIFQDAIVCKNKFITTYQTKEGWSLASAYYFPKTRWDSLKAIKRGAANWHDNKCLPSKYKESDYKNSGYDWGHFTPYELLSFSDTSAKESYLKSNQAMQFSHFNEHPWNYLEQAVYHLIPIKGDIDMITGAIYDIKNPKYIGNDKVPVPIYYFKVVWFAVYGMVGVLGDNATEEIKYATVDQIEALYKDKQRIEVDLYATVRQPQSALLESRNVDIDIIGKKK